MSQSIGVSRQTLYAWKAKGQRALEAAFAPKQPQAVVTKPVELHRMVLTLLIQAHASYRGIQACLKELLGLEVSLGTITAIVQASTGKRAAGRPKTTAQAQEQLLLQLQRVHAGVGYLFAQLRLLLEVVVVSQESDPRLLSCQQRREEVETLLVLLEKLVQAAPTQVQKEVQRVSKSALPFRPKSGKRGLLSQVPGW